MKQIFIDLKNVKAKNGLYYFSINLQKYLKNNGYAATIINCKFNNEFGNYDQAAVNSFARYSLNNITIVPTIRFKLKKNVFYFMHDDYPINQKSLIRRVYNRFQLKMCSVFGNMIYISDSLPNRLKVNKYLKLTNLDIISHDEREVCENDFIYASTLLVGVETDRKNLSLLPDFLKQYSSKVGPENIHIVGKFLQYKKQSIKNLNVRYHSPEDLHRIKPQNEHSLYISLSSSEGFNRGAYFALNQGFQLILSKIPEHEEFYDPMYWFDLSTGQLIFNKEKSMLKKQSKKHIVEFFRALDNSDKTRL